MQTLECSSCASRLPPLEERKQRGMNSNEPPRGFTSGEIAKLGCYKDDSTPCRLNKTCAWAATEGSRLKEAKLLLPPFVAAAFH